jgi:hypothetical protein
MNIYKKTTGQTASLVDGVFKCLPKSENDRALAQVAR